MTTIYVARSLGDDTSVMPVGANVGAIVGGDTALDSRDGDTSYVRVQRTGNIADGGDPPFSRDHMSLRWEHLSGPVPSSGATLTVETEYRQDDLATQLGTFGLGADGLTAVTFSTDAPSGLSYVSASAELPSTFLDEVTDGTPWHMFPFAPGILERLAIRVTYLRIVVAGDSHLRQKNRDSIRARNRASRQRGIRAKGYY